MGEGSIANRFFDPASYRMQREANGAVNQMSLFSLFALAASLAFALLAGTYWNFQFDPERSSVGLSLVFMLMIQGIWFLVNLFGIRELKRFGTKRQVLPATTILLLFTGMIIFQVICAFRFIGAIGAAIAG